MKFAVMTVPILLMIVLSSCSKREQPSYTPRQQASVNSIIKYRNQKNLDFLQADWSPLLPEDTSSFKGLNYYPIDLTYRFEGSITKYDTALQDTIIGTKGDLRPALKYGYFYFKYKSKPYRLEIYKILKDDPEYQKYLFLGFTDATTGKQTYGAGRYIDLTENDSNHYVIDFNLAYNPYCAYNPKYTCAIPPEENRLPFPVTAGEKIYHEGH